MKSSEDQVPLLKYVAKKKSSCSDIRFFVNLGIILIVFKGSEAMLSSCYKQYLYFWSQQYLNNSKIESDNNNISKTTNTSESTGDSTECDKGNKTEGSDEKAQALASQWEMYFEIFSGFLVFFSVSFYGTLSDYLGRKRFGCLSIFGFATKGAVLAAVIYFDLHIAFFFIAFGIDALCGSSYMFSLYSYTSSADITSNIRTRVLGVAVIEMLIGIGALSTNVVNGYLIKYFGYFYSMLISSCGIYVGLVLSIILLKETKRVENKKCAQVEKNEENARLSIKTLFTNYIGFYISKNQKGKKVFWLCLIVFVLVELNILNKSSILTLYELGVPFCWDSEQIGWYDGIYYAGVYVVGIVILKPLLHCFSETTIACLGLVSSIAFNLVVGFATSSMDLYLCKYISLLALSSLIITYVVIANKIYSYGIALIRAVAAGILMVLPKSIIRGMVSSRVQGHKQGAIFAGLQSSETVCKMVAGSISLNIYSYTLDTMRGFVFLVFAGICFINLILTIWVRSLFNAEKRMDNLTININSEDA